MHLILQHMEGVGKSVRMQNKNVSCFCSSVSIGFQGEMNKNIEKNGAKADTKPLGWALINVILIVSQNSGQFSMPC